MSDKEQIVYLRALFKLERMRNIQLWLCTEHDKADYHWRSECVCGQPAYDCKSWTCGFCDVL